ncbi:extracellular matrix protein 2, partial [Neolamprologus brichardi]|uniref:extracellular matrix protein 2 n=1 Tax=Neolamprologus brichardi TaxID=32507 RepID=UPI001643ADFD
REEDDDEEEEEEDDDDDDDEDDDDEDDDDDDDDEEEAEEETTESPSNQTETCQSTEREISCRGIGITHLPSFHNLEATKVDLAENNISIITARAFSGLLNLDVLDLSQNILDDDSFSQNPLSNLTSLRKLDLDDNHITVIPTLPSSLEELKIKNNKLSGLTPHCFKGLMNLLKLELGGNALHKASVSPPAFRPLQRLLDLQLSNNHFRSLPSNLPPSLQTLRMNENLIEELTEEALRGCIHLRVLELRHNRLHEQDIATHAWTRLKSLEALDLSHNLFTSVPLNLPRPLRNLSLQHNSISHIPAFTFRHLRPGLRSLRLSHNDLSSDAIGQFSFVGSYRSLSELLLDHNRLGEVPRCIRQFKNLQVLRLSNNQIRLVRQWSVCHPRNPGSLASVHLENNLLEVEKIPPNAFSCLTDPQGLVLYPQQWSD